MKSIHQYNDYRHYLRDFYENSKREAPSFTYQRFSKLADIKAPNYLKLVMDGKRNLTIHHIHSFARALDLTHKEKMYFEALVLKDQSKSQEEKRYYTQRLKSFKDEVKGKTSRVRINDLVANRETFAIALCLEGQPVNTAKENISKLLGKTKTQTNEVIQLLERKSFLTQKEGFYHLKEDYFLIHDSQQSNLAIRKYLEEQIRFSLASFPKKYQKRGKFFSQTLGISKASFREYSDRVIELMKELSERSDKEDWDEVIQLNIQLFPWK